MAALSAALGVAAYQGTWNASTNTPTLANGVGSDGNYYVVSVAGTQLGILWSANDRAVYNATAGVWQKVEGGVSAAELNAVMLSQAMTMGSLALNGATIGSNALALSGTASADAYLTTSSNVNAQTGTSYTLQNSDNGKTVTMNNASASTLTVPSGLTAGFSCAIVQLGAGQVTITASGTTLRNRNGLKCAGQYAQAGILYIAADTYSVGGDLST
jgi:hypothetical protein